MNCKYCNSPLEPQAHFCAGCGAQVTEDTMVSGNNQVMATEPLPIEATTAFSSQEPIPLVTGPQSLSQQPMPPAASPQSLSQQSYASQNQYLAPTTPLAEDRQRKQRKRRRGPGPGGCILILLTVLVLIFGSLAGVWFLVLRPQIHQMVLTKLDSAMGQAVEQIPPLNQILPPPPPIPIPIPRQLPPITEGLLNNVMKLTLSSSGPLKDPQFHITEQNVSMDFSVQPDFLPFSIPCTVSLVPTVDDQGNVVVTQANVQGLATLVISGDDITPIINRHLQDAMTKLGNPISSIQLQQGAMIITLK